MFEPAWTRLSLCLSVSLKKLCFVDVVLDSHFSLKAMFYEGCLRLVFLFKSFTHVIFISSFFSKGVFHRHVVLRFAFLFKSFTHVIFISSFSSKGVFHRNVVLRLAFLFKRFTDVIFNSSFSSKGVFHRRCLTTRFFLQKLCFVDCCLVTLPFPVNHSNRLRWLPTPPIHTNTRRDTWRILMATVLS